MILCSRKSLSNAESANVPLVSIHKGGGEMEREYIGQRKSRTKGRTKIAFAQVSRWGGGRRGIDTRAGPSLGTSEEGENGKGRKWTIKAAYAW